MQYLSNFCHFSHWKWRKIENFENFCACCHYINNNFFWQFFDLIGLCCCNISSLKVVYVIFFNVWKKKNSEKRVNRPNSDFFFTICFNKCCFFVLALVFDKNRIYKFKDIIIENIFLKNFVILFSGTHSLKNPAPPLFLHSTV